MKRSVAIGATAVVVAVAAWAGVGRLKPAPTKQATIARAGVRPNSVVLITLDTVRADRLGAYGYAPARTPNLDALARNGVRFDDATAPAPITGPSHAAILTGMLPGRFGVRDNAITPLPDAATTLAERLSRNGVATGGFVGAFILDRPYGFAQGFETFSGGFDRVDSGNETNAERPANAVVDDALRWLGTVGRGRPFFAWIHLYDAHVGYHPPPPFAPDYDGEIAFVDAQVGRLLEALRARPPQDHPAVIVVGDHGESLGEHGEDEHGVFLYDAVLRVPLIVSGAGIDGQRVVAEQVRALDVMPTILDLLGVMSSPTDGSSLMPLLRGQPRKEVPASYSESYYPKLHYGWSELRAIRADGWKAVDAPKPELYNLREDPGERHNLYASHPALAARMLAEATRIGRELGGNTAAAARGPDRETLERLRSLGYVGATAALPAGDRGADPKDRVAERREYNALMFKAIEDLRGGHPDRAVSQFKQLLRINARAYDLHQFLGEAYERLGKPEDALGEYAYAALLNPESVTPVVAAAEVHLKRGDTGRARAQLDAARRVEAEAFEVLMLEARILERERRPADALAAYERAAAHNPANPRARTQIVAVSTQIGRWDVAEQHLRKLLEMGYQPARTYFALGRVAQAQGRNADAASHYREALRLEPGLPMALEGLRSLGLR